MKPGAFVFILILIGYTAFEVWAVSQNSYRMQPDFIYAQHVGAAHAVDVCGVDKSDQMARFQRNMAYARQRALDTLLANSEVGDAGSALTDLEASARDDVDTLISESGCDDIEAWKLARRFDLLARQNPPIPDAP